MRRLYTIVLLLFCSTVLLVGQTKVSGVIVDKISGETLVGASVLVEGTTSGTATDFDGQFLFTYKENPPFTLVISYFGYTTDKVEITEKNQKIKVKLKEAALNLTTFTLTEKRVADEKKRPGGTTLLQDGLALKQSAATDAVSGLGTLAAVDIQTASIGFVIANTRGFNSTSPVRSLQVIDGVDNQAPGLNFSLGNFLGSSELDLNKVEMMVGASGAYFGPNAFNGVISMETKDPFIHTGISASVKLGERSLFEGAVRIAESYQNKDGDDKIAFKLNASYLRANDWEADNYDEIYQENPDDYIGTDNLGGYDAVNIYGDESLSGDYIRDRDADLPKSGGLGRFYRQGYEERDIVDYNTRNLKLNAAVHYKIRPKIELITSFNYGSGTTVYQGDNRFSLKGLHFYQGRVEIREKDKFFIRAYTTIEDANKTYDAYFTALKLTERNRTDSEWAIEYSSEWLRSVIPQMRSMGYPSLILGEEYDIEGAKSWLANNEDFLREQHARVRDLTNNSLTDLDAGVPFLVPGTPEFEAAKEEIISKTHLEGGTGFFDKSKLFHLHGEYHFKPSFLNDITVGGNLRQYRPFSKRTIFEEELDITTQMVIDPETNDTTFINTDTSFVRITNFEFGVYGGLEKKLMDERLQLNATFRMDKNENFKYVFSPAASAVFKYNPNHSFRVSYSSAVRNPTLNDQYLFYNVGRAILKGNIAGYDNLITVESFQDFRNTLDKEDFEYFSVDAIKPEKVQSLEVGYRTTLFNNLYLDASYYFSYYKDFIGYNIGIDVESFDPITGFPQGTQVYRVAANATDIVTTQGATFGYNYYFADGFAFTGNYSWNVLNSGDDDPLVPAFNTPEHKYNIGVNGRNITTNIGNLSISNWGFNVNYKWVEGFLFEGSPQFTGNIPSYSLLDAQVNYLVKPIKSVVKVGASNILNNKQFQVYGGPKIGRMAYVSIAMDLGSFK